MSLPHVIDCKAIGTTAGNASLAVQEQATRATQPWHDDPDWEITRSVIHITPDETDNLGAVLSWCARMSVALTPKEAQR